MESSHVESSHVESVTPNSGVLFAATLLIITAKFRNVRFFQKMRECFQIIYIALRVFFKKLFCCKRHVTRVGF